LPDDIAAPKRLIRATTEETIVIFEDLANEFLCSKIFEDVANEDHHLRVANNLILFEIFTKNLQNFIDRFGKLLKLPFT
jgi:hypothetical protein